MIKHFSSFQKKMYPVGKYLVRRKLALIAEMILSIMNWSHSCPCWVVYLARSTVSWNNNINGIKLLDSQCTLRLTKLSDVLSKLLIPSRTQGHTATEWGRELLIQGEFIFLRLPLWITTNSVALNNPNLLFYSPVVRNLTGFQNQGERRTAIFFGGSKDKSLSLTF